MPFPRTSALPLLRLSLLPLLLAACSASQDAKEQVASTPACDASRADQLIGQYANGYNERTAMQASGASSARTLGPDSVVTMDFDPHRINLHTDPGDVIIKLACG